MADLAAQTDLRPGPCAVAATNAQTRELTLAATGAVGDVLSINSSTGKAVKADADSATGGVSGFFGFEYVAKAAAKAAPAVVGGNLIGLSGLTAGVYYYVSRTAGRLCLLTDLNPNDPRIPALYAISATEGLVLRGEKRLPTYRRDSVHVSDDTAGVTSTLLATLHFAKAITVRAIYVTAMTVGAAGATVDVKTGGTPATICVGRGPAVLLHHRREHRLAGRLHDHGRIPGRRVRRARWQQVPIW